MGRYDSHKHPFSYRMNQWASIRTNDSTESQPKSMPCHVVQKNKDFVTVGFETQNGIFTMPTVKMTQSFSGYGREPTQQNDKGYAVPGSYYMGGVSGFAGGNTPFYPRGNLTSLSFQPVANQNSSSRDYDQHTETGGPNGWLVKVMDQTGMQEQAGTGGTNADTGIGTVGGGGIGGGGGTAPATRLARQYARVMQQRSGVLHPNILRSLRNIKTPTPFDTTSGSTGSNGSTGSSGSGQQQQQDQTQFQFDKNGKLTMQSKDTTYNFTMDQQNKIATMNVPVGAWAYVGGDGKTGSYAPLVTTKGPVITAQGRYA